MTNQHSTLDPLGNGDRQGQSDGLMTELSLVGIANIFLRYRRLILILPIVIAVSFGTWRLVTPRTYLATAAFIPQATESRTPSAAAGIARQLGITVSGERPGQSPQFYAELLRSPAFLKGAVESEYLVRDDSARVVSRSLIDHYHAVEAPPVPRWRVAAEELRKQVQVSVNRETGVVTLVVSSREPQLAEQVARRLVDLIDHFNLETRQSQARAEGEFVTRRLEEARVELGEAEAAFANFLRSNRDFAHSPDLLFERDRLQREVVVRQEVLASLTQSREQARIDAVRDTPVITVVADPAGSAEPEPRGTVYLALVGFLAGLMLATAAAFAMEGGRRIRSVDRDDHREFRELSQEALDDLRYPVRMLRSRQQVASES